MTDLTAFGLPADLPDISAPDFLGGGNAMDATPSLTRRQKAAIIVRILLSDGRTLSLGELPPQMQVELTREIGALRQVGQGTLSRVVDEFIEELDGGGLSFSGGLQEALSILEGSISPETARRLSREEGITLVSDPWKRLVEFPAEKLAPLAERESVEVAAILLSKLSVEKSAEVLGLMAGDKARRAAYAVSQTAKVGPETVRTIGRALLAQLNGWVRS
jgi:flagellar motor switch protein FliG